MMNSRQTKTRRRRKTDRETQTERLAEVPHMDR